MVMRKYFLSAAFVMCITILFAQDVHQQLDKAVKNLLDDEQMKHAMMSLYVVDSKTGNIVYNLNEQTGLAPASTQKIFTSAAAFDLLGNDYSYKTEIGYDGKIENEILNGNLLFVGHGDPTFGSWRYSQTKRDSVLSKIIFFLQSAGIKQINGNIILDDSRFSYQPLPGGWIWDDIGNYYGAGTWGINWNENQYDLILKPGIKEGDSISIIKTDPELQVYSFNNFLKTGKPNSGDNGYIYLSPYAISGFAEGTEQPSTSTYTISGSMPFPALQFAAELKKKLQANNISFGEIIPSEKFINDKKTVPGFSVKIGESVSPSLDSIIYFFLQKSINLYGEALIKTMALEKYGEGSTEKGVAILKDFLQQHDVEKSAVNISDGSGLSPQNRITTDALVKILQYAKTRPWYNSFYNALPTYNNMKMKSGTIYGAKAFAGYQTSSTGKEYTFAIIINNFDNEAGSIVPKMYSVLNNLK